MDPRREKNRVLVVVFPVGDAAGMTRPGRDLEAVHATVFVGFIGQGEILDPERVG